MKVTEKEEMIKLKTLLKEQAEFDNVTKALQTAVNTFNSSAATALANEKNKNVMSLIVNKKPVDQFQNANMITTIYEWYLNFTYTGTTSTTAFFWLQIRRNGAKVDVTNIGYKKDLKINEIYLKSDASGNSTNLGQFKDLYVYNANTGTPTVSDSLSSLNNIESNFQKSINNLPEKTTTTTEDILRNTAILIQKSGPKLIEDLKTIFNDIEITPFTPEGKKNWKGMKTV